MKRLIGALCYGLLVLMAVSAHAQMGQTPAPELKKLDFMAGDWKSDGTMNPGPGMPGGKFAITSHADWMDGNFFLVEHSDLDLGPMGKGKELAVLGYDSDRKVYTYTAFNSMGEAESSTGTWISDEHFGGTTMKGRFSMKVLSPKSYAMKFELSPDGKNWNTAMEGKS